MTKKKQNVVVVPLSTLHDDACEGWDDKEHDLPSFDDADIYKLNPEYWNSLNANSGGSKSTVDESSVPRSGPFVAFVGNLPKEISEDELVSHFEKNIRSRVIGCEVVRGNDPSRRKLFGYVTFSSREDLIAALRLNGVQLFHHSLKIDVASRSQANAARGGAGGSGGGSMGNYPSNYGRDYNRGRDNDGDKKFESFHADGEVSWRSKQSLQSANDSQSGPRGGDRRNNDMRQKPVPRFNSAQPSAQNSANNNFDAQKKNSCPRPSPFCDAKYVDDKFNANTTSTTTKTLILTEPIILKRSSAADPFGGAKPKDIKYDDPVEIISPKSAFSPTASSIKLRPDVSNEEVVVLPFQKSGVKSDPFNGAAPVDTSKVFSENVEVLRKKSLVVPTPNNNLTNAPVFEHSSKERAPRRSQSQTPTHTQSQPRPQSQSRPLPEPEVQAQQQVFIPTKPRFNPFGEAHPVDTASKVRQTEEILKENALARQREAHSSEQNHSFSTEPKSQERKIPGEIADKDNTSNLHQKNHEKLSVSPSKKQKEAVVTENVKRGDSKNAVSPSRKDNSSLEPLAEFSPVKHKEDPFANLKPVDTSMIYKSAEEEIRQNLAEKKPAHPQGARRPPRTSITNNNSDVQPGENIANSENRRRGQFNNERFANHPDAHYASSPSHHGPASGNFNNSHNGSNGFSNSNNSNTNENFLPNNNSGSNRQNRSFVRLEGVVQEGHRNYDNNFRRGPDRVNRGDRNDRGERGGRSFRNEQGERINRGEFAERNERGGEQGYSRHSGGQGRERFDGPKNYNNDNNNNNNNSSKKNNNNIQISSNNNSSDQQKQKEDTANNFTKTTQQGPRNDTGNEGRDQRRGYSSTNNARPADGIPEKPKQFHAKEEFKTGNSPNENTLSSTSRLYSGPVKDDQGFTKVSNRKKGRSYSRPNLSESLSKTPNHSTVNGR